MSLLKPKFLMLALASALLPAVWVSGCGGDAFTTADTTSAGAPSSNGGGGSVAGKSSGGGATKVCAGPEDCDDKDACTKDLCNADGTCDTAPQCAGTEKCCDSRVGDCHECCEDSDCTAGSSCTKPTCFAGQCMYVPDDTKCEATQYCSATDGCRTRAVCGILSSEDPAATCDDQNPCTTDSCNKNLCQHSFCNTADPDAKLCCEDGCAACCSDSQCDTGNDPCKVGSCRDGKCDRVDLCGKGQTCCPSADGKTATCGACCSAAECDDQIGCTKDQCAGGQCSHTPGACETGYVCDVVKGCQKAPACTVNTDCRPGACQTSPKCEGGTCKFSGCAAGTKCCSSGSASSACKVCCEDSECNDNIACTKDVCTETGCTHTPDDSSCNGNKCDVALGCVACRKDAECDDGLTCTTDTCDVSTNKCKNTSTCTNLQYCTTYGCSVCKSDSDCQGGIILAAIPIGDGCSTSTCVKGQCVTKSTLCAIGQVCCAPYGCQPSCVIQTQ